MREILLKHRNFILYVLTITVLFFITWMLKDMLSATIFCIGIHCNTYIVKWLEYKMLKLSRYDVDFYYEKNFIPSVKYNNITILRKYADADLLGSKIMGFSFSYLVMLIIVWLLNGELLIYDLNQYAIILYIGLVISLVVYYKDLINFFKIKFGNIKSFYVKFDQNNVELILSEDIIYGHREVYYYEEYFKNYTAIDLKRELIVVEQLIDNGAKIKFWDKCLIPLIFSVTAGLISSLNTVLAFNLSSSKDYLWQVIMFHMIFVSVLIAVIIMIFIFINTITKPARSNLKIQKLVLEDYLTKKEKN